MYLELSLLDSLAPYIVLEIQESLICLPSQMPAQNPRRRYVVLYCTHGTFIDRTCHEYIGGGGVQTPSENSEVLTKLSQIPSLVENTSIET
jgi:hypothetical protein